MKLVFGVYVTEPSSLMLTDPLLPCVTLSVESVSLLASEARSSTGKTVAVFSVTSMLSDNAVTTGDTSTVIVPVAVLSNESSTV